MSRNDKEQGAVLLTTLLVMSLMAALAVAIMDDIRFAVKRSANMQAYAQIDWYARAAEDFAANYIEEVARQLDDNGLNSALLTGEPVVFPIEGGMMAFDFRDGTNCFALSSLADPGGQDQFRRLLKNLGWSPTDAQNLTNIAKDWQDADSTTSPGGAEDFVYLGLAQPYRTANVPFASVAELRALQGLNEDAYQALRPYVCAGAEGRKTQLNINTMEPYHLPLLAAVLGEDGPAIAEQCLTTRPSGGFDETSFKTCVTQDPNSNVSLGDNFIYAPKRIWIEADIEFFEAYRASVFEFEIDRGRAKRTYRRHTTEARRPRPKQQDDE